LVVPDADRLALQAIMRAAKREQRAVQTDLDRTGGTYEMNVH
jgi:hypothetical protein